MKKFSLLVFFFVITACGNPVPPSHETGSTIMLGTMRDNGLRGFLFGYPRQVSLISTDGSGMVFQNSSWTSNNKPVWSPDGGWAVYDQRYEYDADGSSIYIARADGSQPQRLSYHKDSDYDPSWSPDGKYIVYMSNNTERSVYPENGIYTLDVSCIIDGTPCSLNPTFIIKGRSPDWSPDGRQIAFSTGCGQNHQSCIEIINADGIGDPIKISPSHLSCYNPQWSPNGADIMYACYQQSCSRDAEREEGIYLTKSDGTEVEMIANIYAGHAQWSPDGSKIAFISSHSDDLGRMIPWEAGRTSAVFIMDADGTGVTRLSLQNDQDVLWFAWPPFSSWE